jgi:long-chain acyl-CoA synthetase
VFQDAVKKYPSNPDLNMAPGGIQCFRPTFMAAVPKIWDILKKGVEDGVGKKSPVLQGLIHLGYAWRNMMLNLGMDSVVFKALFGKVFKPILGGRQKTFATGGGPIAGEVQAFIRTMFCCPLIQGYALTETTCAGTIQYVEGGRKGGGGREGGERGAFIHRV